jgi:outer membrane protein with beta-barrel domain
MKLKLIYLIVSVVLSNNISAQNYGFTTKAGVEQNIDGERSPSLFIGVSYKINLVKFLQIEFGINLQQHKMKSSSSSVFEIPSQIGEHFLITKLISEEISKLEYSSLPVGIVLNSKENFRFGLGIQPMLLVQQSRRNNITLVNIFDNKVDTKSSYGKIDFTPYNLEFYSYISWPIGKRFSVLLNYSRGIIRINEKRHLGDYVGVVTNSINTKRISFGLSYSIIN